MSFLVEYTFKIGYYPIVEGCWSGYDQKMGFFSCCFIIEDTIDSEVFCICFKVVGLSGGDGDIGEEESIWVVDRVPLEKGSNELRMSLPVIPPPMIPILKSCNRLLLCFCLYYCIHLEVKDRFKADK